MPRKRQDVAQADLFDSAPLRPASPTPPAVDPADTGPLFDPVSVTALDDADLLRVAEAARADLRRWQANAVKAALAAGLSARQVAKQFGVPEKAVRQGACR